MVFAEGTGTITFTSPAPSPTWATDDQVCEFGPSLPSPEGVRVAATKHPNGELEVRVSDESDGVSFRTPLPPLPSGLLITSTWRAGTVTVFVNGTRVGAVRAAPVA